MTPEPFRFLDLPKEIRFMVYERLPRSTNSWTINIRNIRHAARTVTFILRSTPTAILATSRKIYEEALPFFTKAIHNWVGECDIKIVVTAHPSSVMAVKAISHLLLAVYECRVENLTVELRSISFAFS